MEKVAIDLLAISYSDSRLLVMNKVGTKLNNRPRMQNNQPVILNPRLASLGCPFNDRRRIQRLDGLTVDKFGKLRSRRPSSSSKTIDDVKEGEGYREVDCERMKGCLLPLTLTGTVDAISQACLKVSDPCQGLSRLCPPSLAATAWQEQQ